MVQRRKHGSKIGINQNFSLHKKAVQIKEFCYQLYSDLFNQLLQPMFTSENWDSNTRCKPGRSVLILTSLGPLQFPYTCSRFPSTCTAPLFSCTADPSPDHLLPLLSLVQSLLTELSPGGGRDGKQVSAGLSQRRRNSSLRVARLAGLYCLILQRGDERTRRLSGTNRFSVSSRGGESRVMILWIFGAGAETEVSNLSGHRELL